MLRFVDSGVFFVGSFVQHQQRWRISVQIATLVTEHFVVNIFKMVTFRFERATRVGLVGCLKFRESFLANTTTDLWSTNHIFSGVDPFAYVTIASACMATIRHKFLVSHEIAYFRQTTDMHSTVSIRYLEWIMHSEKRQIRHARNSDGEAWVSNMKVDGIDVRNGVVFEVRTLSFFAFTLSSCSCNCR